MKKALSLIVVVWMFVCLLASFAQAQETLTFTTYYPSPFGAYDQILLVPRAPLAGACTTGTMYVRNDTNQAEYCSTGTWGSGGGLGFWTQNGTSLYPSSTTWNVGIGTTTPRAQIDATAGLYLSLDSGILLKNDMGNFGRVGANIELFGANGTDGAGGSQSQRIFIDANNGIFFRTDSTPGPQVDLMTINSTGNVGIGTQTPFAKLDVNGQIRVGNAVISSGTVNVGGRVSTYGIANVNGIEMQSDNARWEMSAGHSGNGGSLRFRDVTNSADRMTINTSGVVTISSGAKLQIIDGAATNKFLGSNASGEASWMEITYQ